jgi:hypothetical protein
MGEAVNIRGSATLILIFRPWKELPLRVKACFKPSLVANSAYPKPFGFISSLSSMIRTLVHSQPAKKSVTSPTVASNDKFPR